MSITLNQAIIEAVQEGVDDAREIERERVAALWAEEQAEAEAFWIKYDASMAEFDSRHDDPQLFYIR